MKKIPRLERWYVGLDGLVHGAVYDDWRFYDGMLIHTSTIVKLDRENKTLQTKNTLYQLGQEV